MNRKLPAVDVLKYRASGFSTVQLWLTIIKGELLKQLKSGLKQVINLHSSSENIGTMIFEIFLVIIDIIVVQMKFWFAVFEGIYKAFFDVERDVKGDIVLITGAGHGMGKELALQYSALGATIVCWDVNEQMNLETVKLIKSKGGKAYGYT